jgi:aerobic carbon-monoxide dehydrogenase small subunit
MSSEQVPDRTVTVAINGREHTADIEPRTLLVDFIRTVAGLTGTHVGCDTTSCGACTVQVDGRAMKSCTLLALQVEGRSVRTIEGVAAGDELHPLQSSFHEHHALQCGYCTPGMIMRSLELLDEDGPKGHAEIREGLAGNICRCTGYQNIVEAIAAVASGDAAAAGDGTDR